MCLDVYGLFMGENMILIKDGRVIDPVSGLDGVRDVLICEGKILCIKEKISEGDALNILKEKGKASDVCLQEITTINAAGKVVACTFP